MSLSRLFDDHRTLRAVIESAIEGVLGSVTAESITPPRTARLDLGCYSVFGGCQGEAARKEFKEFQVCGPCGSWVPPRRTSSCH